ncbi:MAG: ATP-binding protein, partial [Candidatus Saliniplasma sp.]
IFTADKPWLEEGEEIKSIWDRGYPVKFIVSGSSSMNILKGGGESLVGRISLHRLYPFSFGEFLKYYKVQFDGLNYSDILENEIKYPVNSGKIQVKFEEYLKTGGFPEILTKDKKKDYLNDIVSLTFYRDIMNMLPVKRTEVLEGLFYNFIRESGQVINYNKLADSLDTKYETVKDYIDHLESSFLIEKSTLYSKNKLKSIRKNPKIYVADHGFSALEKMEKGLRVETAVYNHITRNRDAYYWKDRKELDVVVDTKQKPIPIEVKFKEQISKKDVKGLIDFMKKTDVEKGLVVSKNDYKTETVDEKSLVYVPAWLFLLSEW